MAYKSAFNSFKKILTEVLILAYYKQGLKTIVKIDSFDYVSSGVLSELGEDRLLHLIAFFLKNLNSIEYNYKIYNKELLAIIQSFE